MGLGLGLSASAVWFRVQCLGSGCGVSVLGFRVQGWCWGSGFRFTAQGSGFEMNCECLGFMIQDRGYLQFFFGQGFHVKG